MDVQWDAAMGALAGSGIAGVMAKIFVQKSLKDIANAIEQISKIQSQLAAIAVKLEHSDKHEHMLLEHDRKISALEAFTHGPPSTFNIHKRNL